MKYIYTVLLLFSISALSAQLYADEVELKSFSTGHDRYVGIGVNDPVEKLEVNGNVKVMGELRADVIKNEAGNGAANFPLGLKTSELRGDFRDWIGFPPSTEMLMYENVPQGIYLLSIRGIGAHHSYATFVIHLYDPANNGKSRLLNTGYNGTEWYVHLHWNNNNHFDIEVSTNNSQNGKMSLLKLI